MERQCSCCPCYEKYLNRALLGNDMKRPLSDLGSLLLLSIALGCGGRTDLSEFLPTDSEETLDGTGGAESSTGGRAGSGGTSLVERQVPAAPRASRVVRGESLTPTPSQMSRRADHGATAGLVST